MRTIFLLITFLIASASYSFAQYAYFPNYGEIQYEKTIFVKNLLKRYVGMMEDENVDMFTRLSNEVPETVVQKSKLAFEGDKYTFEEFDEDFSGTLGMLKGSGLLGFLSTYQVDLASGTSERLFDFFGQNVIIEDSLQNITWKLTDEYREIAGYECRRANGVVFDSISVVAFYTEQIPHSLGPNTSHGLPGAILGYVVPQLHFHIYATKINVIKPTFATINAKKAERLDHDEFSRIIKTNFGNFFTGKLFDYFLSIIFL